MQKDRSTVAWEIPSDLSSWSYKSNNYTSKKDSLLNPPTRLRDPCIETSGRIGGGGETWEEEREKSTHEGYQLTEGLRRGEESGRSMHSPWPWGAKS